MKIALRWARGRDIPGACTLAMEGTVLVCGDIEHGAAGQIGHRSGSG